MLSAVSEARIWCSSSVGGQETALRGMEWSEQQGRAARILFRVLWTQLHDKMNGRSPEDDNICAVDLDVPKQLGITKEAIKNPDRAYLLPAH